MKTPIINLNQVCENNLFVKREDLIPFSFANKQSSTLSKQRIRFPLERIFNFLRVFHSNGSVS